MFRPRVIPILLLKGKGLVKTVKFKNEKYIGDPINAVHLFNGLRTDELVFLDINATKEGRYISPKLVQKIGNEAFMPFAVGGGITSFNQVKEIITAGAEKVVLNTAAFQTPELITQISETYGKQSVIVSIDVKKTLFGKPVAFTHGGSKKTKLSPVDAALLAEKSGAGEIVLTSIEHEGLMNGYHESMTREVSSAVSIPVIANGGLGKLNDLKLITSKGASAAAGGSFFVYQGPRRGILINYPELETLKELFN